MLVGIGWYFFGVYHTDTERKLGIKEGLWPLFENSAPLLGLNGFPVDFFKKRVPINSSKTSSCQIY
jgi:hypothetical protein